MVGLLGKEPGVAPTQSKKYGVKIIEPILDAMGIAHHWVEEPDDTQKIVPAIEKAYASTRPMAVLIKGAKVAMMQRDECLKAFKRHRKKGGGGEIYMAAQEMTHIMPNDLNYTFTGAMGRALPTLWVSPWAGPISVWSCSTATAAC